MAQNLRPALDDPHVKAALAAVLDARASTVASGDRPIGWKVAITHPPTQVRLGLAGPLLGYLLESSEFPSGNIQLPEEGIKLAELEIGLRLGADVSEKPDLGEARRAILEMAPALEIVSITQPLERLDVVVAANAFHTGVRFGSWIRASETVLDASFEPSILHNGRTAGKFGPEFVPGRPEEIVRFMAETLAAFGERLRNGDRIICGCLNGPVIVGPGSQIVGILVPLGKVELSLDSITAATS